MSWNGVRFSVYALVPAEYADLTWQNSFLANLLPVTIGNIIGCALMVGLVYWFIYLWPSWTNRRSPVQT